MIQRLISILVLNLLCFHVLHADELPAGQVGLSPSILENLRIGPQPVNESIRFYNFKEEPVTVSVDIHNWTIDKNNKIKLLPPDQQSLDQWITVNPLEFTVQPKKSHIIRLSILPRVKPAPGEHRAILYFTEKPSQGDTTKTRVVRTRFRIGAGIYAITDPVKKQAVLHSFRLDGNRLSADIENTGNVHVRFPGKYAVWHEHDFPGPEGIDKAFSKIGETDKKQTFVGKGQLNRFPVLPGTRRTISTVLPDIDKRGGYIIAIKDTLAGTPKVHTFKFAK